MPTSSATRSASVSSPSPSSGSTRRPARRSPTSPSSETSSSSVRSACVVGVGLGLLLGDPLVERLAGGLLVGRVAEALGRRPLLGRRVAAVELVVDVGVAQVLEVARAGPRRRRCSRRTSPGRRRRSLVRSPSKRNPRAPGPPLDFSSRVVLKYRCRALGAGDRLVDAVLEGRPGGRRRRARWSTSSTAPHPPGTEVDPRAWLAAADAVTAPPARPGRRGRGRRPAARHGRPRRRRRAGARRAALERHPLGRARSTELIAEHGGPAGLRRGGGQRPGRLLHRRPSCAGCATTSRSTPPASRGCCSRTTTSRRTSPRPAPRRSPTAATPPAPATTRHREERWRPDLLEAALGPGRRPAPTSSRPAAVAGADPRRPGARRRHRRQHGGRARHGPRARRRAGLDRHLRRRVDGQPDPGRRRHRHGHRLRRRHGRLPPDGHHDERRRASSTSRPRCSGVDHDGARRPRAERPARRERPHAAALLRRRAHPQPAAAPSARGPACGPTTTRADLARAAYEALLCSLADAVDLLSGAGARAARRLLLVGGAARSAAVRALAPAILGRPVVVPPPGEYVALGAARQAAWALAGTAAPPAWPRPRTPTCSRPTRSPRCASATPSCATAPSPGPDPPTDTEGTTMSIEIPTPDPRGQVLLRPVDRRLAGPSTRSASATRPPMDTGPRAGEAGRARRLRRQLPRRRRHPVRQRRRHPRRDHRALQEGAGRHRAGGHHRHDQPLHPPGLQGRRASPTTTATSAGSRSAR